MSLSKTEDPRPMEEASRCAVCVCVVDTLHHCITTAHLDLGDFADAFIHGALLKDTLTLSQEEPPEQLPASAPHFTRGGGRRSRKIKQEIFVVFLPDTLTRNYLSL